LNLGLSCYDLPDNGLSGKVSHFKEKWKTSLSCGFQLIQRRCLCSSCNKVIFISLSAQSILPWIYHQPSLHGRHIDIQGFRMKQNPWRLLNHLLNLALSLIPCHWINFHWLTDHWGQQDLQVRYLDLLLGKKGYPWTKVAG
jgi:hypothetical protein